MKAERPILPFKYLSIPVLIAVFFISGCGSSRAIIEEKEYRLQEQTRQIEQLQFENAELRREIAQLSQSNRSLNAQVAELEKQLIEEREQIRTPDAAVITRPEPGPERTDITPAAFENEYNLAIRLFRSRRYQDAKDIFTRLLHSGADHPLISNCQHWIGESLFGMREYNRAIEEFMKVFNYESKLKHDHAQIMIANSYFMLGNNDRARQEYQRLIDRYPNSVFISFARQRLREI